MFRQTQSLNQWVMVLEQGNMSEEDAAEIETARKAFEEAGQLVVDADQAQEDALLARQEADRLDRCLSD